MNKVRIKFVKKVNCDKNIKEVGEPYIVLTINCDGCSAILGCVESVEVARKLIEPKDIIENMRESLSGDEFDCFEYLMMPGKKYYFYDEEFTIPKK